MITAQQAHDKTNKHNINRADEELKYCENMIVEGINHGKFGVMFNKSLMSETIECLRSCGYKVTEGFNDEIRIEW